MIESTGRYRQMLETDPRNTEALNGIANVLVAQGKLTEAETYFLKVLEIDERNTEAMNGMGSVAWKKRDQWYKSTQDHRFYYEVTGASIAEAERWYKRTLSVDPQNLRAINEMSQVLDARFNLGRAIFSQEHDV